MKECRKCHQIVHNPQLHTWYDGCCPKCLSNANPPKTIQIPELEGGRQMNPVDMYWHMATLRQMLIDDSRKFKDPLYGSVI